MVRIPTIPPYQSPDYSGLCAFWGAQTLYPRNSLRSGCIFSADNTRLLGGFRQCSNSAINPLGIVALGVTQQQAGMVDVGD